MNKLLRKLLDLREQLDALSADLREYGYGEIEEMRRLERSLFAKIAEAERQQQ